MTLISACVVFIIVVENCSLYRQVSRGLKCSNTMKKSQVGIGYQYKIYIRYVKIRLISWSVSWLAFAKAIF